MSLKTNFACGGITEEQFPSAILVSSVALPDGSSYSFTYETTPGFAGYVTGRLASVTLPTGGRINYTYVGANDATDCTDGTVIGLNRQTSDGTTTYRRGPGAITTVTTPSGSKAIYTFTYGGSSNTPLYETQAQYYDTNGSTLLKTVLTCYNGNTTNCATALVTQPITERNVYTTLAGMTTSARSDTFYDSTYGVPTSSAVYDFGGTTPVRTTVIGYGSFTGTSCAAISNIHDYVCLVITRSGGGTGPIVADHTNVYDSLGNLLTSSDWVSGSTWLSKTFTYNAGGTLATTKDVNGTVTNYTYTAGSCNNAFPTSVSSGGLTTSFTWDSPSCNGAVLKSVTDANAKQQPLHTMIRFGGRHQQLTHYSMKRILLIPYRADMK